MTDQSPAFEKTYRMYLAKLAGLDMEARAGLLGLTVEGGEAVVSLYGRPHRVSSGGVTDPSGVQPVHSASVVLCQYLLLGPSGEPPGGTEWVTFKDFRDAAPFVDGFVNNSERAIARSFSGRLDGLRDACRAIDGEAPDLEVSYQLKMRFQALPRVPVVLLFNDEDEEFPAESTILFERRAERHLDMECLAILGWMLADRLAEAAGGAGRTIM
jgi:hypothetical protein